MFDVTKADVGAVTSLDYGSGGTPSTRVRSMSKIFKALYLRIFHNIILYQIPRAFSISGAEIIFADANIQ